jgi:hypothetical protein
VRDDFYVLDLSSMQWTDLSSSAQGTVPSGWGLGFTSMAGWLYLIQCHVVYVFDTVAGVWTTKETNREGGVGVFPSSGNCMSPGFAAGINEELYVYWGAGYSGKSHFH